MTVVDTQCHWSTGMLLVTRAGLYLRVHFGLTIHPFTTTSDMSLVPSRTMTNADMTELVKWAEDKGVQLHGITPVRTPGRGIGVTATRKLEVSGLLAIPILK